MKIVIDKIPLMTLSSVSSLLQQGFSNEKKFIAAGKNFVSDYCNNKAANILKNNGMSSE
jgi:hypothetical protein